MELRGRAWAGRKAVVSVEVSCDGGATWLPATLGERVGRFAWTGWTFTWTLAAPGLHVLSCRAYDEDGGAQDGDDNFNVLGLSNTMPQRVEVLVSEPAE